jgi:hypothetical protein
VGKLQRSYAVYLPARLVPRPPLLLALPSSKGDASQIRRASGYRFEELADEHGFIVVYPEGYEGHWNDCRKKASFAAKRLEIDDVSFVRALIAHLTSCSTPSTAGDTYCLRPTLVLHASSAELTRRSTDVPRSGASSHDSVQPALRRAEAYLRQNHLHTLTACITKAVGINEVGILKWRRVVSIA